jgi:hypothetical protein
MSQPKIWQLGWIRSRACDGNQMQQSRWAIGAVIALLLHGVVVGLLLMWHWTVTTSNIFTPSTVELAPEPLEETRTGSQGSFSFRHFEPTLSAEQHMERGSENPIAGRRAEDLTEPPFAVLTSIPSSPSEENGTDVGNASDSEVVRPYVGGQTSGGGGVDASIASRPTLHSMAGVGRKPTFNVSPYGVRRISPATDANTVINAIGIRVPDRRAAVSATNSMPSSDAGISARNAGIVAPRQGVSTPMTHEQGFRAAAVGGSAVHSGGINGTSMTRNGLALGAIGGPTSVQGVINGTSFRQRHP